MSVLISVLTATAVVSALGAALAGLVVLADAVLADYGPCEIVVNRDKAFTIDGGGSLLAALTEGDIFIPSSCGGRGSCALCKVRVLEGAGPVLPTEEPHLSPEETAAHVRLSCQIKVRSDLSVEIPQELLTVQRFRGTVDKIEDLTHDIKRVRIKLAEPKPISFRAGQYVQLECPAYGDNPEPVYRAYSIASPPSMGDAIEMVVRLMPDGICTTWVFRILKEGDEIYFNGPYGEFFLRDTGSDIVLIAGGSGLAPIRSILMEMAEQHNPRRAALYFGALGKRDLYYVDQMHQLQQELPSFEFIPALSEPSTDDPWDGETGLITEVLDRCEEGLADKEAYLCGSPGMIDACVRVMQGKGLEEDRIYYDKFA